MTQTDQQNTQGVPFTDPLADTASQSAPEKTPLSAARDLVGREFLGRIKMPKYVAWIVAAAAAGVAYIVGTKAGSSRFRELSAVAKNVWNDPGVQKAREKAYAKIDKAANRAAKRVAA